jgi:hypothetical protein
MEKWISNMFADDTEIEDACKPDCHQQLERNLNEDLGRLKSYFDTNRLSLNVPKCEFMQIGTHQSLAKMPDLSIHINNEPLQRVSMSKYLGLCIDENLRWEEHINYIIPKISAKIGVLRKLRSVVPIDTLKLLYNAIVLPHFDYADTVYDSASETSKIQLQRLQTRAARLISGSGPRASRNPMFKQLSWLSLQNRRDFHKCTMVFKCRNGLAPEYLMTRFKANDTKHSYNTRNASQLRATKTRTQYYNRSFTVSGHRLWNSLPTDIHNCSSLPSFKSALFKHMSTKPQF